LNRFLDNVRDGKCPKELFLPRREYANCSSLFPRKNYDNEKAYLEAIADYVVTRAIPLYKDERDKVVREKVIGPLYSAEAIAKQLATEERLDGKIDKDAMSIGRLKTMQGMIFEGRQMGLIIEHEPVKQINLPAQIEYTPPDQPPTGETAPPPAQSEAAEPPQMEAVTSPPIQPEVAASEPQQPHQTESPLTEPPTEELPKTAS
jgi:hypothetical protein